MTSCRIAWRNLWRNWRRTGLALAAIGLSVTLVLVYNGLLRAYGDWMVATITGPMVGHVQVHAPDWRATRGMDQTVQDLERALAAIRRDPGVTSANARIYAPALAALGQEGFAVLVVGLDVQAETAPQRLLSGVPPSLPAGQVLVGDLLARKMGLHPGDVIALVGQGADGSLANDLFTVAAPVHTAMDFVNRQGVMMGLQPAQDLFAMPDEAHEIIAYTSDPDRAAGLAARLAALPELAHAEVLDWKRLAPGMVTLIEYVHTAWILVLGLVFVAALAGVANTMLMSTFERTHELGMLLALGTSPSRLVWMTMLESVALGVMGAVLGGVVGAGLVAWGHHTGVNFQALTGGGPTELTAFGLNWSLLFYPTLAVIDIVRVAVAVVVTSILGSAWPAARVARLQPAGALRA
jgi:putative ABC transport system permease protein